MTEDMKSLLFNEEYKSKTNLLFGERTILGYIFYNILDLTAFSKDENISVISRNSLDHLFNKLDQEILENLIFWDFKRLIVSKTFYDEIDCFGDLNCFKMDRASRSRIKLISLKLINSFLKYLSREFIKSNLILLIKNLVNDDYFEIRKVYNQ